MRIARMFTAADADEESHFEETDVLAGSLLSGEEASLNARAVGEAWVRPLLPASPAHGEEV